MTNFEKFMRQVAEDVYEEPRTVGHDHITNLMATEVAKRLPKSAKILDVGCGQGPALEWFTRAGFEPEGIALSDEDVDACITAGFEARKADQHNLGMFYGEQFDCIWARHVLEHSIAPFWVLHELHRILVKGGTLYVEVPAPETSSRHESNPNHYSVMGYQMWLNLISRSGFSIVEARELTMTTAAGADKYFSYIAERI